MTTETLKICLLANLNDNDQLLFGFWPEWEVALFNQMLADGLVRRKTDADPKGGSQYALSDAGKKLWIEECAKKPSTLIPRDANGDLIRVRPKPAAQTRQNSHYEYNFGDVESYDGDPGL